MSTSIAPESGTVRRGRPPQNDPVKVAEYYASKGLPVPTSFAPRRPPTSFATPTKGEREVSRKATREPSNGSAPRRGRPPVFNGENTSAVLDYFKAADRPVPVDFRRFRAAQFAAAVDRIKKHNAKYDRKPR